METWCKDGYHLKRSLALEFFSSIWLLPLFSHACITSIVYSICGLHSEELCTYTTPEIIDYSVLKKQGVTDSEFRIRNRISCKVWLTKPFPFAFSSDFLNVFSPQQFTISNGLPKFDSNSYFSCFAFLLGITVASKDLPPKALFETYCWKSEYLNPGETVCCNNPSVSFESVYLGAAVVWSSHWTLWYDCGCMGTQSLFGTLAGDCCNTPYTNVNCTVCVTNTNQLWTHEWDIQASGPCTGDAPIKHNVQDGTITNRIKISEEDVPGSLPKVESIDLLEVIYSFLSTHRNHP